MVTIRLRERAACMLTVVHLALDLTLAHPARQRERDGMAEAGECEYDELSE